MKIKGKQVFDFGNIGKPQAIPVEAFRPYRMSLRVYSDVVCQRFSASKAQALVADAFTDFLGTKYLNINFSILVSLESLLYNLCQNG